MTKKEAVIAFMKDDDEVADQLYEEHWAEWEGEFDGLPLDEQEDYGWKEDS